MEVSLKNFTSLICSTFCQIIIFFIPTHFYKIYILIRMQFVHGKQCTSKDRNFNRAKLCWVTRLFLPYTEIALQNFIHC